MYPDNHVSDVGLVFSSKAVPEPAGVLYMLQQAKILLHTPLQ